MPMHKLRNLLMKLCVAGGETSMLPLIIALRVWGQGKIFVLFIEQTKIHYCVKLHHNLTGSYQVIGIFFLRNYKNSFRDQRSRSHITELKFTITHIYGKSCQSLMTSFFSSCTDSRHADMWTYSALLTLSYIMYVAQIHISYRCAVLHNFIIIILTPIATTVCISLAPWRCNFRSGIVKQKYGYRLSMWV